MTRLHDLTEEYLALERDIRESRIAILIDAGRVVVDLYDLPDACVARHGRRPVGDHSGCSEAQ